MVENDFKDVESVRSGQLISRSQSTSVISSSSCTKKIAEPRLKFAAKYWDTHGISGNVFGWSTFEYFDNLFRNAQFKAFLLREIFQCKQVR